MRWPMFEQVQVRAQLLDDMMACIGANSVVAARRSMGAQLLEARANCIRCGFSAECRRWIEQSPQDCRPPPFCCNREFLSSCTQVGT